MAYVILVQLVSVSIFSPACSLQLGSATTTTGRLIITPPAVNT